MKNIIPIGEFKTHCYKLLDQAQKNHKQLTITRKGKAIAQILPLNHPPKIAIIGAMKDIASINSDIIEPINIAWDAQSEDE